MLVKLPKEVSRVLSRLKDAGFEAYVVGECVRDSVLGKRPYGWDVTTNANINQLTEVFPEAEVFSKKFGVVRLEYIEEIENKEGEVQGEEGIIIDISTYRKDAVYSNGLLTDASMAETIEDDLSHRDFTINAIAENGTDLCDVFQGRDDIRKKLVRTVGDANLVFKADPIKMFRAIRIASELGFDLHKSAYEAIVANADLAETVDPNKVRDEFMMTMTGVEAGKGLNMLLDTGLIAAVLGQKVLNGLTKREMQDLTELSKKIDKTQPVMERRLGLFYACIDRKRSLPAIERMNYDEHTNMLVTDAATLMPKFYFTQTKVAIKKFIYEHGWERYNYLASMEKAQRIVFEYFNDTKIKSKMYVLDEIAMYREPIFPEDLAIDANDLVEAGICKPEKAEAILKMLVEELHTYPRKNTRDKLMKLAKVYSKNKIAAWFRGIHFFK